MENEGVGTLLFANTEAKVVGFDGEEEVHAGQKGELRVRGPNVAKGYWQNGEATEKSFANDGWLRTGDAATIDDLGNLSVLARVQVSRILLPSMPGPRWNMKRQDVIRFDDQIINPSRIERVLLSHPEVLETVVYGASQTEDGSFEGKQAGGETFCSQSIRAYIVKAKGSNLTAQDVDNFLVQQAPAIKRLSGGVVFLDSIPKTTVSLELLLKHEVYLQYV